jgi:ribonuclease HI
MVAGFLGENTNNVADLTSLLRGLQIAIQHQNHRLIIEGDSQVIIQLITKILNGKTPGRISPSWRLSGLLEDFGKFIHPNLTLIPSHIKRDANKVADYLANSGIDSEADYILWQAHFSEETTLSSQCKDLASRDFPDPDGVTRHPESVTPGPALRAGLTGDLTADGHPRISINNGGRPSQG